MQKRISSKHGFTLMEMLIVVAVIAILIIVAIPVFSAQLEKTREGVCSANRRSLQGVVMSGALVDEEKPKAYFEALSSGDIERYPCPASGSFSWVGAADAESGYVTCSKHGGNSIENQLYKDFREMYDGWKNAGKNSNDAIRAALLKEYGSKWPQLVTGGKTLTISPYINLFNNDSSIVIFANGNSATENASNWYSGYIYDPDEQRWYSGKSFSVNSFNNWQEVKQEMQNRNWQPLADYSVIN